MTQSETKSSVESSPDPLAFDLNDTEREPSDEQLAALMEAVAEEARRRAEVAREVLSCRLREAIIEDRRSEETG